jgi:hypothetical protein
LLHATGDAAFNVPCVWRYINLAKFLDLLQTSELHFTRLDRLEDPYESSVLTAAFRRGVEAIQTPYVNCWFQGKHQSAAMWAIYGRESGVAIKSSRAWLNSAFTFPGSLEAKAGKEVYSIGYGPVQYQDEHHIAELLETITEEPRTWPNFVFVKRISFSHEKETRLVISLRCTVNDSPPHLRVKVNLERLINRIYVAPNSPEWIADVVRREVEKYGLKKDVIPSDLFSAKPE